MAQIEGGSTGDNDTSSNDSKVKEWLMKSKLADVYPQLVELEIHEMQTIIALDDNDITELASELKLKGVQKIKFKTSMKNLRDKFKPKQDTQIVHITDEEQHQIDKIDYGLKQIKQIKNIFEKHLNQIDDHIVNNKTDIDNKFNNIYKLLKQRQITIHKQIDDWKIKKSENINKIISSIVEYETELQSTMSKCNKLFKSNTLSSNSRGKQIKDIISSIFNDKNKRFQDVDLLQKYINDNTTLINIKYQQNIMNDLLNFGDIDLNAKNDLLSIASITLKTPIKIKEDNNRYKIKLKWNMNSNNKSIPNDFTLKYNNVNVNDDDKKDPINDTNDQWMVLKHQKIKCLDNEYEADVLNKFLFDKQYQFIIENKIESPIYAVIKSNIQKFMIGGGSIDISKEEEIPLKIHAHKGHHANGPENLLNSNNSDYWSIMYKVTDDWIVFSVNNTQNNIYYPTKLQVRARGDKYGLKRFRLKIGNSSTNQWMECNEQIFTASKVKTLQTFNLDIMNKTKLTFNKWKQISQNKWREFRLEILDNYGESGFIIFQEFKLFGVPR